MNYSKDRNFKQDIETAVAGEKILALVLISASRGWQYDDDQDLDKGLLDQPLDWETYKHLMDYEYDAGFGSQDCHDVRIYTEKRVYYIHEYDGSTSIYSIPRNPPELNHHPV
jgi:hypothetical protein